MKKLFKWLGIVIGIIILIILLAILCLTTLVNPNRYKPFIAERVMEYTGHPLMINGDLSWTVFPYFGMKVNQLTLQNTEEFKEKTFAEIDHVTVMIKLFPLMKRKVESSGITIDGMKLYLITNEKGQHNWTLKRSPGTMANDPPSASGHLAKTPLIIAIAGVNISNSTIYYTDAQKNQTAEINHFELHAQNINLLNAFPVTSTFDFSNPTLNANVSLQSDVALNMATKIFAFKNIIAKINLPFKNQVYDFKASGDLTVDFMREILEWTRAEVQLKNMQFIGDVNAKDILTAPKVEGHFELHEVDLKETLQALKINLPNLEMISPVNGNITFTYGANPFALHGTLTTEKLRMNGMTLTHLSLPIQLNEKVLLFSPISADFYQGKFNGTLTLILNSVLSTDLNANLSNFQVEPLLKDLKPNNKLNFTGLGNVTLNVKSEGSDRVKNLNGNGHLSIANGILKGVDVGKFINMAYTLTRKAPPFAETGQTDFGSLTGNFLIKDGIVSNNDLLLNAAQFTAKGQGTIDLTHQTIQYHLQAALNNLALSIPIEVSGNLEHPKMGLDTKELAKALTHGKTEELPIKIKGKAGKFLQNLLGN